jgi:hypothetical protein
MTCRELTERLLEYDCGGVESATRRAIEMHLTVCDPCLRYAGQYQVTVSLAGANAALRGNSPDRTGPL